MRHKHPWLAALAVGGLAVAVVALVFLAGERQGITRETGQTRAAVEAALDRLVPAGAATAAAPALAAAAQQLQGEPYVAWVWVVNPAGEIVVHAGGPFGVGTRVQEVSGNAAVPMLAAVPPGTLSPNQKVALLAVGAMRAEGEHNDVFRHLVRPVAGGLGGAAAWVVVAYAVSPGVVHTGAAYMTGTLLFVLGIGLYWLGLPLWVYADARRRGEAAALWALWVLATNLVGLLSYLISTVPPRTHSAPGEITKKLQARPR